MILPAEFSLIARHFRPLAGPGALDLLDDAAVLAPPQGRELVISADAMVEGVHFLPADPADLVARKLLRTNLSDLAAMGAVPLGYLMTVSTRQDTPDNWYAGFAAGLAVDQAAFQISLLGGDTTSTPGPISLSLTIIGTVAPGAAIRRSGARIGDEIWVSGTIGDGALGLLAAQGLLDDPDGFLADRYRLPRPRIGLAQAGVVQACMDVSDGLIQDLGHLCRASGLSACVQASCVPRTRADQEHLVLCLTGGDDYELLMAVRPGDGEKLQSRATKLNTHATRIGTFGAGPPSVQVYGLDGAPMHLDSVGWSHFTAP